MSAVLHHPDVCSTGVSTLTISDGVHKPVLEFLGCAQKVWLHKVNHGVVYITQTSDVSTETTNENLQFDWEWGEAKLLCDLL